MNEIIDRIRLNCRFLTTLDVSKMDNKWLDKIMEALKTNTHLKKIKIRDDENVDMWFNTNREIYFVDKFIAFKDKGVIFHIYSP